MNPEVNLNIPDNSLPRHVAIIMDGNGRWAKKRLLPRIAGHREGVKRVREIVRTSGEIGISYLTLYTFSAENWSRPADEVKNLMKMLEKLLRDELDELNRNNVQFEAIGRIAELPENVQEGIRNMRERLASNTGLVLVLALNYGGRQEIVDMARKAAQAVATGDISIDDINIDILKRFQYMPELPEPDLLIRTGAEKRTSNFLVWQTIYTELYFTGLMWPEFTSDRFKEALLDYAKRERRFGSVEE